MSKKTALNTWPSSSPNLTTDANVIDWKSILRVQNPNKTPEVCLPLLTLSHARVRAAAIAPISAHGEKKLEMNSFFDEVNVKTSSTISITIIRAIPSNLMMFLSFQGIGLVLLVQQR